MGMNRAQELYIEMCCTDDTFNSEIDYEFYIRDFPDHVEDMKQMTVNDMCAAVRADLKEKLRQLDEFQEKDKETR
jgi:hypothetical protein